MGSEDLYDLRYAYRAAAILASIPMLVMYTEGMLIPSLPSIQKQFGVSESSVAWVLSLYLAFGTVSAALLGRLGDIYGKKRVMMAAMAIYTAGALVTGYAPSFEILLIARAVQGAGIAMMPLAFSLVREEFPPNMIPQIQGVISAMFGVGILISLPLGGYISQNHGWQATYHTVIPFILIENLLVAFMIRESRFRNRQRIDWVGASMLTTALMSGIIGVSMGPRSGWKSFEVLFLLGIFGVFTVAFIAWEVRARNPLVPVHVLSNRNILLADFGIFMVGFAFQLISQANIYIFEEPRPYGYGLNILEAGLWSVPNALVQLAIAPVAGRYLVRIGARRMSIAGSLVAGAGMIALSRLAFVDIPHMILSSIIAATGSTLLNISLVNLVMFSVDRRNLGTAAGINTVFRNLGSAWGPAVAGTILDQFKDSVKLPSNPQIQIQVPSQFAYQLTYYITASLFTALALAFTRVREIFSNRGLDREAEAVVDRAGEDPGDVGPEDRGRIPGPGTAKRTKRKEYIYSPGASSQVGVTSCQHSRAGPWSTGSAGPSR